MKPANGLKSCLYEGRVTHRRRTPIEHAFTFRFFYLYMDLAELPALFDGRLLWSFNRSNLAAFHRKDYLGDPSVPLDTAVRGLVEERTGRRPEGPVRLLTQLRYAGHVFNPVSFYYCFDKDGKRLETVVAEITNTPWNERFQYVLTRENSSGTGRSMRFVFDKQFHVSPFMEMDHQYDWRFTEPGEGLGVRMDNLARGGKVFDAVMTLKRREIGTFSLARALVRYPLMTVQIVAAIYWQALRLKMKGATFYAHPESAGPAAVEVKK